MQLSPFAFLAAIASLSLAAACKSDEAGGAKSPERPTATAAGPATPGAAGEVAARPDLPPAPRRMRARADRAPLTPEQRQERRAERMKEFDADGDGRLSRDERTAMRSEMMNRRLQRIDSDGDGKISRQEADARPQFRERLLGDFATADANRDSFISREELDAVVAERRKQRRRDARQRRAGGAPPPADQPASADPQ